MTHIYSPRHEAYAIASLERPPVTLEDCMKPVHDSTLYKVVQHGLKMFGEMETVEVRPHSWLLESKNRENIQVVLANDEESKQVGQVNLSFEPDGKITLEAHTRNNPLYPDLTRRFDLNERTKRLIGTGEITGPRSVENQIADGRAILQQIGEVFSRDSLRFADEFPSTMKTIDAGLDKFRTDSPAGKAQAGAAALRQQIIVPLSGPTAAGMGKPE